MSDPSRQQTELNEKLITRAWTDPAFREALKTKPKETLQRELGISLPPDVEVEVVQETAKKFYLVLPAPPPGVEGKELSDEDLSAVSGGTLYYYRYNYYTAGCTSVGLSVGSSAPPPSGGSISGKLSY